MLSFFYKLDGKTESTNDIEDLDHIETKAVVWVDLYNPTEAERRAIE